MGTSWTQVLPLVYCDLRRGGILLQASLSPSFSRLSVAKKGAIQGTTCMMCVCVFEIVLELCISGGHTGFVFAAICICMVLASSDGNGMVC